VIYLLYATWHVIKEKFADIINSSLSRGCFQKIGNIIFGIVEQWMTK